MLVIIKATGKVQEVAEGYARNYLFPKGLAEKATTETIAAVNAKVEAEQAQLKAGQAAILEQLHHIAQQPIELPQAANPEGKLFGSVTNHTIAELLRSKSIMVDDNQVNFEAVKQLGEYKAYVEPFAGEKVPLVIHIIQQ